MPVHLTANDAEQGFAVDQDFHSVLFHNFIEGAWLLDIFEVVSKTGATFVLHANSNELRLWLRQQCAQLLNRSWSDGHGRLPWAELSGSSRLCRRLLGGR